MKGGSLDGLFSMVLRHVDCQKMTKLGESQARRVSVVIGERGTTLVHDWSIDTGGGYSAGGAMGLAGGVVEPASSTRSSTLPFVVRPCGGKRRRENESFSS